MSDTWDGVPLHPERDGWHWIGTNKGIGVAIVWCAENKIWMMGAIGLPPERLSGGPYLGPCLTPDEVQARETAAYQRGQEDMREQAADCGREIEISDDCSAPEAHGRMSAALAMRNAIRALPIKEAPHE